MSVMGDGSVHLSTPGGDTIKALYGDYTRMFFLFVDLHS